MPSEVALQHATVNGGQSDDPKVTAPDDSRISDLAEFLNSFLATKSYEDLKAIFEEKRSLERQLNELKNVYKGIIAYSNGLIEEIKAKDDELELNREALDRLRREVGELQFQNEELNNEQTKAAKKNQKLEKEATESRQKIEKVTQKCDDQIKKAQDVKKEYDDLRISSAKKDAMVRKLEVLEGFSAQLTNVQDDTDNFRSALRGLLERAHNWATEFLFQDLDEEARSLDAWEQIKNYTAKAKSEIPLPASNSLTAKQMRFALGLEIISSVMQKHIFQPIYMTEDQDECAELLCQLDQDPTQEAHVRSVLLNALPAGQMKAGEARAKSAATIIFKLTKGLVPAHKHESCEREIQGLCDTALKAWMPLQRVREQVNADMVRESTEHWRILRLPGISPPASNSTLKDGAKGTPRKNNVPPERKQSKEKNDPVAEYPVCEVWPAFIARDTLLHAGCYLIERQVAEARIEVSNEEAANRAARREKRVRTDRRSSNAFLPSGNGGA